MKSHRQERLRAMATSNPMPGPIKRATARSTGTVVEVWRSEDFGDEQTAPYVTICEHSSICEHDTRALAISWSAAPEIWCETGCRDAAAARASAARHKDA